MITDPWFYVFAIPATVMIGLSKSGFAGGIALIAVPLMALGVPPFQAAGILLPILIAMDVIGLVAYRGDFDRRCLAILLPAAAVGIFIGWLTAAVVSEAMVRLTVGLIAAAFTLDYWLGLRPAKAAGEPDRTAGSLWGAVAGFTSFVSHAGSAPLQMFLLPLRLSPTRYAGTSVIFFASVNALKIIPYFALGNLSARNLMTSAALVPFAALAMFAGIRLIRVIAPEPFYRLTYFLVFVVALKLIWDGGWALAG